MMSMLHLLWIVPLVAAVAWGWGYKANPERVKAFVKAHIVDEDPYQDEGHSATRYAPEPGESPIAREARKAAEVEAARPEEIEIVRRIIEANGACEDLGLVDCTNCPSDIGYECRAVRDTGCIGGSKFAAWFRNWLLDHGINPDEASK